MKGISLFKKITPILALILLGAFVLGYHFTNEKEPHRLQRPERVIELEKDSEDIKDDTAMDYISEPKITPDTRLIFKTTYLRCGHTVIDRKTVKESLVGLNRKELLKLYPDWSVEKFENEEVILCIHKESACPGHYVLRAEEDCVAIYEIVEGGQEVFIETTDIPLSILRLGDQHRIRQGLLLDNIDEVNRYLEDLGS